MCANAEKKSSIFHVNIQNLRHSKIKVIFNCKLAISFDNFLEDV